MVDLQSNLKPEEKLLFPVIGFLADVADRGDLHMPPKCSSCVEVVSVDELHLGVQMVLGERVSARQQPVGRYRLAAVSIERQLNSMLEFGTVRSHWSKRVGTSTPTANLAASRDCLDFIRPL